MHKQHDFFGSFVPCTSGEFYADLCFLIGGGYILGIAGGSGKVVGIDFEAFGKGSIPIPGWWYFVLWKSTPNQPSFGKQAQFWLK